MNSQQKKDVFNTNAVFFLPILSSSSSSPVHAVYGGLLRATALSVLPDATKREHLRAAKQALSGSLRLQRLFQQHRLGSRACAASSVAPETKATGKATELTLQ